MLIAIFICLILESIVEGQDITSETLTEQFGYERLQGQCSAYCYQRYGTWTTANSSKTSIEGFKNFLCRPNLDEDCHACDIGCSRVFVTLQSCYRRCNNKEPCKEACRFHRTLSLQPIDLDVLSSHLDRNYPPDVYEDPDGRSNSSITLWWSRPKMFQEETAVVYLIFLANYTTNNVGEKPEGLYMGKTPHFVFAAQPLSPDYCYVVHVLTVHQQGVVGMGHSNQKLTTNEVIHIEELTSSSVHIWFQTRQCGQPIEYKMQIYKSSDNIHDVQVIDLQEVAVLDDDGRYSADVAGLSPNTEYKVIVKRSKSSNDMFQLDQAFKTLPVPPDTTVTLTHSIVTPTNISLQFQVEDERKMYSDANRTFVLQYKSQFESDWRTVQIPPTMENSGMYEMRKLTPFVQYCIRMAVRNPFGIGPFSNSTCLRTASSPAPAPRVRLLNITHNSAVLEVTKPDPPLGDLTLYNVTFMNDTYDWRPFPIEDSEKQLVTIDKLNSHTTYTFLIHAVNRKEIVGKAANIEVTTLQSIPEAAPGISTCQLTPDNSTHYSAQVSWTAVHEDHVNGIIENYTLLVQKVVKSKGQELTYNHTYWFTVNDTEEFHVQPLGGDILIKNNKNTVVRAKLSISTEIGQGPWHTEYFVCTIDKMGMQINALQISLPIIGVVAVLMFVVGVFFYFFRFKTYKKTPYEEIKKLISPDTFSPCQHCMHNKEPKRWDVFICHVSEDENYIIQLKEAFVREKIDVFFAKDELSWGCELHRVIHDGLRDSKYGLVVLSKSFVNKCSKWTNSELSSLHSKSRLSSQDCILPIWKKDISEEEVGAFDMSLVGILALKEEDMSVDQMAVELKNKLRNEGCWGCSLRKLNTQSSGGSTPKSEEQIPLRRQHSPSDDDEEGTSV